MPSHLTKRGTAFYYIRRVPQHVRHLDPREKIRKSIGRVDRISLKDAEAKANAMDRDFEAYWDALIIEDKEAADAHAAAAFRKARLFDVPYRTQNDLLANSTGDDLRRRIDLIQSVTPAAAAPAQDLVDGLLGGVDAIPKSASAQPEAGERLALISEAYAVDVELYGGKRSEKQQKVAIDQLIKALGDVQMQSITHSSALKFMEHLQRHRKADGNPLEPASILKRVKTVQAIWNRWQRRAGIEKPNPFRGTAPSVNGAKNKRLPFHRVHLDILAAGSYSKQTGAQIALMRATGIGLKELAGLIPGVDLVTDGPIPYIWVRANERRDLKTGEPRDRRIPLIGISVQTAQSALLDRMTPSEATSMSAKLVKAMRAAGLPKSPKLSPYSFRHTLKQAMREAGSDQYIVDRIMGHAGESGSGGLYGASRARLEAKRDALLAAQSHLGLADLAIYGAAEMPPILRARAQKFEPTA